MKEKWIQQLVEAGYNEEHVRRHIHLIKDQSDVDLLLQMKEVDKAFPIPATQ